MKTRRFDHPLVITRVNFPALASELVEYLFDDLAADCASAGDRGHINVVHELARRVSIAIDPDSTDYVILLRTADKQADIVLARHATDLFGGDPHVLAEELTRHLERQFSHRVNWHTARRVAGGPRRPTTPLARRLVAAAARALPTPDQARYGEEFRSELAEIAQAGGGRQAQLAYAIRQVLSSARLRSELASPRRRSAVP